jgi:glycosyltransferase involved in cell wall biosynthesis
VTVLLAVHDGEDYLREALDSVLAQTFTDFELLVVDDGSGDRTPEILAAIRDERLRVLRNEANVGQVPSLNRGLREARGEYVARLDHDDWCRPDRLERQVALLDAEPRVAVVGSWATVVVEDGHPVGHVRQRLGDRVEFVYWTLVGWVRIPHPSATFRRQAVLDVGGYDEALGPAEDQDLLRRLALHGFDARVVEEELIRYRLHERQLSRIHQERQQRHMVTSHEAFLGALAGDAPMDVTNLRLLLNGDPHLFARPGAARRALQALDAVLAGAAQRLELDAGEQERLERLLRARVSAVARAGRGAAVAGWWRQSPVLARYGLEGRGASAALDGLAYAAALPLAPLAGAGGRTARKLARPLLDARLLGRLEEPARRSRLARRLYSWLIETRG